MIELVNVRTAAKVTGMPTSGIILLAGYPKSGKTWLGASAPDSYVVELEKGGDRVPHGRIHDVQDILNEDGKVINSALNQFNDLMYALLEEPSVKTIVIDTVDQLAQLLCDDIAKEAGVEHMMKPKPGVDTRQLWGEFAQRVRRLTDSFKSSGKLIILIAHTRPQEKDDQGRITKPAGINVSGKGGDYICAQAEMIGHVGVRVVSGKAQHFITFRSPSDLAIWRTRVEELADQEIVLDKKDPWGSIVKAAQPRGAAPEPPKLVEKPVEKQAEKPSKTAAKGGKK